RLRDGAAGLAARPATIGSLLGPIDGDAWLPVLLRLWLHGGASRRPAAASGLEDRRHRPRGGQADRAEGTGYRCLSLPPARCGHGTQWRDPYPVLGTAARRPRPGAGRAWRDNSGPA